MRVKEVRYSVAKPTVRSIIKAVKSPKEVRKALVIENEGYALAYAPADWQRFEEMMEVARRNLRKVVGALKRKKRDKALELAMTAFKLIAKVDVDVLKMLRDEELAVRELGPLFGEEEVRKAFEEPEEGGEEVLKKLEEMLAEASDVVKAARRMAKDIRVAPKLLKLSMASTPGEAIRTAVKDVLGLELRYGGGAIGEKPALVLLAGGDMIAVAHEDPKVWLQVVKDLIS